MTSRPLSALACLIFVLASMMVASADDLDHVRFEGVVADVNGHRIPNARVIVRGAAGGGERETMTDGEGGYRFTMLAPGIYQLRVEAEGFRAVRLESLRALAGASIRRNFSLDPAAVAAEITIDAGNDQRLVDGSRTVVGATVTRGEVDRIPTETRNPFDLIFTLAGAAAPALSERDLAEGDRRDNYRRAPEEAGIFALNGGAPFSNNLTIEGLDNNDDRAARERFIPSTQAVEEVQVIANQFSAEYGRASGGRVNLRLRGGANRFHGQGVHYFRDESLNANGFRRNADPARARRLPYQNQNPALSAGGPLVRNRVFWFAAYERDYVYDRAEIEALLPFESNPAFPLPAPNGANLGFSARDKSGTPVIVNDGAAVGLYDRQVTTPRAADTFQARIDIRPGGKHDGFALVTLARNRDERGFPGGRRMLETLRRAGRDSGSIALADNFIVTPRTVNSLRVQFSRLSPADAPPGMAPVALIDIDDPRDIIGNSAANPFTRRGQLVAGASTIGGTDRREERTQAQEVLHLPRGSHTVRVGGDLQILRSRFVDLTDATGTFTFATLADFLKNRPARYEHRFFTDSGLRNTYIGLFAQEDWRPRRNLTLAAGIRWDNETILRDRNNSGPRAAVAWDPRASTKTVVRAGAGIFYNRALLRTLDDYTLTSKTIRVDTNAPGAAGLLSSLSFPGVLRAGDPRIGQFGVREAGFIRRLEPGFRVPESYQASLGFERELGRNLRFEANYVFSRGLHLWRESNANAARLPEGYGDFTDYLTSRDFDNRRDPLTGQRPITTTGNADIVRFNRTATPTQTIREGRGTVVVFGLANPSTSNATSGLRAALAAIRGLRPDPSLTQIEELQARGNSRYHGLGLELQTRFTRRGHLRASYTLSRLRDDGVVNTSSPLVAGDFDREWSLSLLDARHRLALSGDYGAPRWLGGWRLAGILNFSSSRPFNIGVNGNDRNLDDVSNDRPVFTGNIRQIRWRRPGEPVGDSLADAFSLPIIGSTGDLPRNAGRGPRTHTLNLRVSREFRLAERLRLEFQLESFNPLNATVFSFGAEFVDFTPAGAGDFLVPARTVKPRAMRMGVKLAF
ncbi:MAG: carboxypeptidase regulatory-like domain-containing protein [Blastocatellia bacterium]